MTPIYAVIFPAENTAEPHPSASRLKSVLIDEWSATRKLSSAATLRLRRHPVLWRRSPAHQPMEGSSEM
jgi:hypothetical protein